MLVTTGSHSPATLIDTPATKTLLEDMIQAELVARPLSSVPTNEEPAEESSTDNQLGESYMADVQHNGNHVPFHCANTEACEHFRNHFQYVPK